MSRAALGFIILFGFALRFRAANHPYISQWDEAYHALVAKNLTAHPLEPTLYEEKVLASDDRDWTKARVWLHKPPLPLWLMAAGIAAFGPGEISFRLPGVLLDTGAILLVYLLALELFGASARWTGVIAAALYALNPLMIRLVSGRIPDDTPHVVNAFFITLTVYLFAVAARKNCRAYAAAAGLSLGLGTLCMSAVALLGLAAPLPLLWSLRGARASARLLAVASAAFLAAALPWPLYCLGRWPDLWRHESALHVDHLFRALEGHAHSWWWYVKILPAQHGGVGAFVWASAAGALIYASREALRFRHAGLTAALAWICLPYAFFSVIATKLYSYTAVAVPALCLLAGFAASALWAARGGRYRAAVLATLLAGGLQTGLVAFERLRANYSLAPWSETYDYPAFRRVMLLLREERGPKVLLNVGDSKSPQAMYYSGAAAYPDAPTPDLARSLIVRGFRVFILVEEEKRGADVPQGLRAPEFRGKLFFIPLPSPLVLDRKHPYEA